ncbi:Tn3 family transposase [Kitasatospora sp. NPDC058190]|uniref:Tn3 family transposase n=1 Tax=Kitasatospora sp. NPDC058190 TaxID=3346371 RepID=UPI0036D851B5
MPPSPLGLLEERREAARARVEDLEAELERRYPRDRALQREIEEGLNVVEAWNRANAVIYYGKGWEISSNRREEVEMAALCLRILQASLVYVNTLMLQAVLAEPAWADLLGPADRRGLTPLFRGHVHPYGEVKLNLASRLEIGRADLGGLGTAGGGAR